MLARIKSVIDIVRRCVILVKNIFLHKTIEHGTDSRKTPEDV